MHLHVFELFRLCNMPAYSRCFESGKAHINVSNKKTHDLISKDYQNTTNALHNEEEMNDLILIDDERFNFYLFKQSLSTFETLTSH